MTRTIRLLGLLAIFGLLAVLGPASSSSATPNVRGRTPVTITALDQQKIFHFGSNLGTAAFTVSGLTGSDSISSVTLTSAGADAGAAPGSYALVPSDAVAGEGTDLDNYDIHYAEGTLGVLNAGVVGLDKLSIVPLHGHIDSFDSSVGPYGGFHNSGGDAIGLSNGTASIGHVVFAGHVISTQGNVRLTTSAAVVTGGIVAGTAITNPGGHIGITATANRPSPAIAAPTVAKCTPFSTMGGITGRARAFTYFPSTGDLTVNKGTVTLANGTYCFHNVWISSDATLRVNGAVTINLTGKWWSTTGKIANMTHVPSNLQVNSSYAGTNGVSLEGNKHAYLTLVAPSTGVSLVKGTFFGRILAETLKVTGQHTMIHQDVQ